MRVLLLAAGAALTLSACGGGQQEADGANATGADANMMATDNMMMDQNMTMDQNAMMNGGATMNGTMATDPATQNAMQQDMNTNDPDTNLANGM